MKITADTNALVRAMIGDDEQQSALAQAEPAGAELVAIALPSLRGLVWVLSQGYKVASDEIADAARRLTNAANVVVNRPAVEAGLALLDVGGDFADGVIAYEGRWLGGATFASFDRRRSSAWQPKARQHVCLNEREGISPRFNGVILFVRTCRRPANDIQRDPIGIKISGYGTNGQI